MRSSLFRGGLFLLCWVAMTAFADDNIKQPALAGTWYPAAGDALSKALGVYFDQAAVSGGKDIGVVIAPHAGYDFSAWVAPTVRR